MVLHMKDFFYIFIFNISVKAVETVFKIINMKKYNKASVYKLLIQKATKLLRKISI